MAAGLFAAVMVLTAPAPARAESCNFLQEKLGQCTRDPAPPPETTNCNQLAELLGLCTPSTTTPAPVDPTPDPNAPCGGVATVPKTGGGTWSCHWSDEFSGSDLDRDVWHVQVSGEGSFDSDDQDCNVDSPDNIQVTGGNLVLTSRIEDEPFICADSNGPREAQITSAAVNTFQTISVTPGSRVEFRAKVTGPKQPGLQESFWLYPQDFLLGGPFLDEIDVAEIYHDWPDRAIPFIHHPLEVLDLFSTKQTCLIEDINDWNTYVVEWKSNEIRIIYNGNTCLVNTMGAGFVNKPHMIAIMQALGVHARNRYQPGSGVLPASTVVDYVRVYR